MNAPVSLKRRLALALLRRARWLLPTSRLNWARAMQAELDHLGNDRDALNWALGCVVAGVKERINTMFATHLKVSRWIFVPEMLLCFVPLTLLWLASGEVGLSLIRMNGSVIQKDYLSTTGGIFALATVIAGAVLGALGPLGLIAALRLIVSGHPPIARWFRFALIAGPALYGVVTLAARWAVGGSGALRFDGPDSFDFWSGILLLSAMPSLGAAHLLHLASLKPHESLAAT